MRTNLCRTRSSRALRAVAVFALGATAPALSPPPAFARPPGQVPEARQPSGAGVPSSAPVEAETVIRYEGTPAAGSRISVGIDGEPVPGTTYRWEQIAGPPVVLNDPDAPKVQLTVPAGADEIVLRLVVADSQGRSQQARVVIPIRPSLATDATAEAPIPMPALPEEPDGVPPASPAPAPGPRADAGDDQIGLVGRRITLNGSRSGPGPGLAFRWFQMAGPPIRETSQEGPYYSFVPTEAGIYRFGLVVAREGTILGPDDVTVEVGEPPAASGSAMPMAAWGTGIASASPTARVVLGGGAGPLGGMVTERVAEILDEVAFRVDLYSTFADLTAELMRRIDAVVPQDPQVRQLWDQAVFGPMSRQLASELYAAGLDLRLPQSYQEPLSASQKERLQAMLRGFSREFRWLARAR
ncbi:hypothetical protein [Tautonia sociabilis]|uniref:PKD domain-containing protein n=1 Tax=Tautonia sociabilis TaxID=2080755 RepID=A0A432MIW3_9BACT|nr:hypothetical protein [Tautonia sociabilis]RUL87170.1 hypothetical protein TsocGM_13920 [Tautonia sociabilis]